MHCWMNSHNAQKSGVVLDAKVILQASVSFMPHRHRTKSRTSFWSLSISTPFRELPSGSPVWRATGGPFVFSRKRRHNKRRIFGLYNFGIGEKRADYFCSTPRFLGFRHRLDVFYYSYVWKTASRMAEASQNGATEHFLIMPRHWVGGAIILIIPDILRNPWRSIIPVPLCKL